MLTVSDRVSVGAMNDEGGPAVEAELASAELNVVASAVVPDELTTIAAVLARWADDDRLDVIFTTGGTGMSARDVTPEATVEVCSRLVPGIGEAMRAEGREHTAFASLSRGLAGIRGTTLVVNLPGSPRGAREGVRVVAPLLAHAVATLHGGRHPG